MCVATVIQKGAINVTSVLHLLGLNKLKAIIAAYPIESYYCLEKCRGEIAMQIEQFLKRV